MYRSLNAVYKSIFIFAYSIKFLNLRGLVTFWLTSKEEHVVVLDKFKIGIRAHNLRSKIVDLYMAVSCILWKQYDQENRPPTGVVIDIGGHIGTFSICASRSATKVITFEPDESNFRQLKRNIELNGIRNIIAINKGVAGKSGERVLFEDNSNSAAHSMVLGPSGSGKKIECLSLEDAFKIAGINSCDFIKLDCEGAEFEILMNTPSYVFDKINRISMEYHLGYDLNKLLLHLKKSGFEIIKNERENSYQGMIWAKR